MPLIRCLACFCLLLWQAASGNAQSCTFSNTGVNFGNVTLGGGGAGPSATGTLTANCTGIPALTVEICANFNAGSGGVAASGDPRYLLQGVTKMAYNLFQNKGPKVWGSYTWAPSPRPPKMSVKLNISGNGSTAQTIFADIDRGQGALPTGTYQSVFSGTNVQIDYGYSTLFNCSSALSTRVQSVPFTVRVTNNSSCTVSTTDLNFGNQSDLTTAKTATNAVFVTCTGGTLYDIGLSNGSSGGSGPTARLMKNVATPQAITYGIYRNIGNTLPWGNVIGSDTVSATGTGLAQNFTGYGQIPVQPTPPALVYTDTVVVTVTY